MATKIRISPNHPVGLKLTTEERELPVDLPSMYEGFKDHTQVSGISTRKGKPPISDQGNTRGSRRCMTGLGDTAVRSELAKPPRITSKTASGCRTCGIRCSKCQGPVES